MSTNQRIYNIFQYPKLIILLMAFSWFQWSDSLVVPQELPSILSVIYSNIPPIKKGTDSRLGFGFRLGEHADFQVMLELGPQKETRPIGDQDSESSFNKRQADKNELRKLYWKQQLLEKQQQQQQQQQQQTIQEELTSTERNAANWLQNWSSSLKQDKKKTPTKTTKSTKKHEERSSNPNLPIIPVVPEPSLNQLQLLYKMATSTEETPLTKKKLLNSYLKDSSNLETQKPLISPSQDIRNLKESRSKAEITKDLMNVSLGDE